MAEKATKTDPSPKSEAATGSTKTESKTESSASSGAAPANYSRGEGQKSVTQAYRDNWQAIFGKPARKVSKAPSKTSTGKPSAKRKPAAKAKKPAAKKTRKKSKR